MEVQFNDKKIMDEAKEGYKLLKEIQGSKDWKPYSLQPCAIYTINVDTRVALRGQTTVNFPIQEVIQFLKGTDTLKKLNPRLIEINFPFFFPDGSGRVSYTQYQGHWPVANRDFISDNYFYRQSGDKFYLSSKSSTYPFPEVEGVVRGQIKIGGYIVERIDPKCTKVTYISDSDIKGNLPEFIKNILSTNQGEIVSKIQKAMKSS